MDMLNIAHNNFKKQFKIIKLSPS